MKLDMSKNVAKKVIIIAVFLFFESILLQSNFSSHIQEEWVAVLKSNDIAAGDLVPVEVDGLAILVAADLDGKIFAIANSCPHLGTPLENGRSAAILEYILIILFILCIILNL